MKNSKLRRALLLLAAAVLLVSLSVGATLAYLTDSKSVTNTFTVGNVKIKLDEAVLNEYDPDTNAYTATTDGARTTTNSYHMVPGVKMDKDPTVTVLANSEDCYVRAFVTITYNEAADTVIPDNFMNTGDEDWVQGYKKDVWVVNADGYSVTKADGKVTRTYELRYHEKVLNATSDNALTDIFTSIKLPDDLSNNDMQALDDLKIEIVAHAIQAQGFADADAAWAVWEDAKKDAQ